MPQGGIHAKDARALWPEKINVTRHTSQCWKERNSRSSRLTQERHFQRAAPFGDRSPQKTRDGGGRLNTMKDVYENAPWERMKVPPVVSRDIRTFSAATYHCTRSSGQGNWRKKRHLKPFLFAGDMILTHRKSQGTHQKAP